MATEQTAGRSGRYWTPFKTLVADLQQELKEMPLKDAAKLPCMMDYRRRSEPAQRRALTDYLVRDLVPGWGLERQHGVLMVVKKGKM